MKIIYILWLVSGDQSLLNVRGVWFDNIISCEIAAMEASADTGRNLNEFRCVPSSIGGEDA